MKKRWKLTLGIIFIISVTVIPILIDWCIIGNDIPSNVNNQDWIAFLGGYIGRVFTLAGVLLTLLYYRKQEIRTSEENGKRQVAALYWFLRFKIHTVNAWDVLLKDAQEQDDIAIPHGQLIYDTKQRFFEQTKDTLDLSKVSFLYKETSRNDIIDKTEIERSRNIMEKKYKCPCCGYYTFDHVLDESYDICPVCFWEDSYYDYEFPDDICSCNKVSLNQAQANYLKYGACKKELAEYVREPNEEEKAGTEEKNNSEIDEMKPASEYQPDFIKTLDGDQIYNIKDKPEKKSFAEKIYDTHMAIELILSIVVGIILLVSYIKG